MLRASECGVTMFICDSCGMKAKIQDSDVIVRLKAYEQVTPLTLLVERYNWTILPYPVENGGLTTKYYCPTCWKKRMELAHEKQIMDEDELKRAYQDVSMSFEAYKKKIENEKG